MNLHESTKVCFQREKRLFRVLFRQLKAIFRRLSGTKLNQYLSFRMSFLLLTVKYANCHRVNFVFANSGKKLSMFD